jgi:hypothetical protein
MAKFAYNYHRIIQMMRKPGKPGLPRQTKTLNDREMGDDRHLDMSWQMHLQRHPFRAHATFS